MSVMKKIQELLMETRYLNDDISMTIRRRLIINDENQLLFDNEPVTSPGQLGIKVLQLIDGVKQEHEIIRRKNLS